METIIDLNRKNFSGFKTYSANELSTKVYSYILDHKDIELRVNEFNKKFPHQFKESMEYQLCRSLIKHYSPIDIIKWGPLYGNRENEITNDYNQDNTVIEIRSIVSDFIKAESDKAMDRISFYKDQKVDGNIIKKVRVLDYSVIITPEQFPNYRSILFNKINQGVIMHYYFEFINWFPVTLAEFEKIFFMFITFLTEEQYPYGSDDSDTYIRNINEIVKMRYIDLEDRFILALLYILSIDKEFLNTEDIIFREIKKNYDMTTLQCKNMAS